MVSKVVCSYTECVLCLANTALHGKAFQRKRKEKMKYNKWTYERREHLQQLLLDGAWVSQIARELHVSRETIHAELKRGLTKQDYDRRLYSLYRPTRAALMDLMQWCEGRPIEEVLNEMQDEARRL